MRASRSNRSTLSSATPCAVRQELQRDVPPEPRVLGLIDDAHAAGAELADDAVVLDLLADHGFAIMAECTVHRAPCTVHCAPVSYV